MEFKDVKEAKNWSFAGIDNAISSAEKEMAKVEAYAKKLREVKWQKVCEEMKEQVVNSKLDFSIDDLQKMLLNKKTDVADKVSKQKNKSSRAKKSAEDDSADSNSLEKKESVSSDVNVNVTETTSSETTTGETVIENKKIEPQIPQYNWSNNATSNTATENVGQNVDVNADDIVNNPAAEKADDTEEIFEDANSQTTPQVNSQQDDLKKIAEYLGMPKDVTFTEVRQKFNANKNYLMPGIADNFEQVLGKMERGEIV